MTIETLLAIAGGVVLLGNAGAIVYKWIRPALQIKEEVEELDRRTRNDYDSINELKGAIKRNEEVNKLQLVVMLDILNHLIDGNDVDEMKETRKKVQQLLANKE